MSFVSKGEKKMRNMARKAGPGADGAAAKDSFGRKGDDRRSGAPHNMAPGSKDKTKQPVSEDAMSDSKQYDASPVAQSEYDPASGKRAKTLNDLRSAYKKLNERSEAGEASPVGKEGGQEGEHGEGEGMGATGYMKAGMSEMDKKSKKPPAAQADQMGDEMEDPMDEDQEDNGQYKEGMTPKGQNRTKYNPLKKQKKRVVNDEDYD